LDVVHVDIGYGDCKAIGGAKYCAMLVDKATRYVWVYALQSLTHESITKIFSDFRNDAGALPKRVYTDFDSKIIAGPTEQWLASNHCTVRAAPGGRQHQNGLVERAWQTATCMARSYITDMQMPRTYWYWAIRHAVHVMNYFPCHVNGLSTTPFELVYGVKPDLRTLF
jgi:transposase InsO family protein